jgi:hypothetical protein
VKAGTRLFERCAALAGVLLLVHSAIAQTPSDENPTEPDSTDTKPADPPEEAPSLQERAKESFKAGAAAYAAGDYLAAIQALDAAYALTPLPAIGFSIAQAERRQYFVDRRPEHLARSVSLFRRYLAEVPNGGRRSDAVDALAQLEPLSARAANAAGPAPSATPDVRARVMVMCEVPAARISIDGGEAGSSPLIRELTPGRHQVEVRAAGYRDTLRSVVAVAGELVPISVVLPELPGRLRLSAPLDAEVYVDGAFVSQGGADLVLELPSGKHRVSVAAKGYRVATRALSLDRGETEDAHFELSPTGQRLTSHVLLVSGAAAIGGGIALGLLSLNAEGGAQDFLKRKARENVTPAQLVRYEADVAARNRFRWLAGGAFTASLGLLITGLFLHELDTPGAEDIYRSVPQPDEPPLDARTHDRLRHFDVGALLGPGQLGATFRTDF